MSNMRINGRFEKLSVEDKASIPNGYSAPLDASPSIVLISDRKRGLLRRRGIIHLLRAALWILVIALSILPAAILYGSFTGHDISNHAFAAAAICCMLAMAALGVEGEMSWRRG